MVKVYFADLVRNAVIVYQVQEINKRVVKVKDVVTGKMICKPKESEVGKFCITVPEAYEYLSLYYNKEIKEKFAGINLLKNEIDRLRNEVKLLRIKQKACKNRKTILENGKINTGI